MYVRILLLAATTPLVFFAYSALHRRVEANWPIFAYLPAAVLAAQYVSEEPWNAGRVAWADIAIMVALGATLIIHLPEPIWGLTRGRVDMPQWDELFGWRDLARNVESARLDWRGKSPVFTSNYEYAAELQFYLPGQPDVRPLPDANRPTAYDFSPGRRDWQDFDRVVLIRPLPRDLGWEPPMPWLPLGAGMHYSVASDPSEFRSGHLIRHSQIETALR